MSLQRFHVPDIPESGQVVLPESESHHAIRVLRCQVGDDLLVFDGNGYEGFGTISAIEKRVVHVQVSGRRFAPRDSGNRLRFVIALPKGDRQRNVIEKLVELGVDRLTPLESARSVAHVESHALDRLERYEIESCKQCQRNRRMAIDAAQSFEDFIARCDPHTTWLAHPANEDRSIYDFVEPLKEDHNRIEALTFLVGPEGGFTDDEVKLAKSRGVRIVSLGDRILRVETAVAALATLALVALGRRS